MNSCTVCVFCDKGNKQNRHEFNRPIHCWPSLPQQETLTWNRGCPWMVKVAASFVVGTFVCLRRPWGSVAAPGGQFGTATSKKGKADSVRSW